VMRTALLMMILSLTTSLNAFGQSGEIRGKVVDASNGLPIFGTVITLKELPSSKTVTQKDGTFDLVPLKPGVYTIIAKDLRYWPVVLENCVVENSNPLNRTLELTTRQFKIVKGKEIASVDSSKVASFLKAAEDAGDLQAQYLLSERLAVDKPTEFSLKTQAAATENALLRNPTRLSGKITDPTGVALAGVTLTLKDTLSGRTVTAKSDASGDYSLALFPMGSYTITAFQGRKEATKISVSTMGIKDLPSKEAFSHMTTSYSQAVSFRMPDYYSGRTLSPYAKMSPYDNVFSYTGAAESKTSGPQYWPLWTTGGSLTSVNPVPGVSVNNTLKLTF
jgi:hypothetical protein